MGLHPVTIPPEELEATLRRELCTPGQDRLWYVAQAFREGYSLEKVHHLSGIDLWFLSHIHELVQLEKQIAALSLSAIDADFMRYIKHKGFSDQYIANLLQLEEDLVRKHRYQLNIHPVYKRVDTCAGEFPTETAYLYSTYEKTCEASPSSKPKVMVLGGGPNRIGQGIEFDYCCVHASLALQEAGYETIMVNCNPETVSTDYDISNRLYFEPVTLEDVLEIVRIENPKGVIVHYGGQTPLKLAAALAQNGVPIMGTTPDAIDCAEDRERFQQLLHKLGLRQPENGIVRTLSEGVVLAEKIGYPLMVRPSYVLGGRAMEVVYNKSELCDYLLRAFQVSHHAPVLLDRFLDNAIEVDVDAICDGKAVFIAGIMEHIEQAGVHSGDSSCSLPPYSLSQEIQDKLREQMTMMAKALNVVGLVNAQFAIQDDLIYVLEVNPRASRTVPFVSKAIGLPLAKIAAKCKVGLSLSQQHITEPPALPYFCVKVPVFPFTKFPGVDTILGPEMKSTGEAMGIADTFGEAFAKGQLAVGFEIVPKGNVFISVRHRDKPHVVSLAQGLLKAGYAILATRGTAAVLTEQGIPCQVVNKVAEGRPDIVDLIKNDDVQFIINTTEGKQAIRDSASIRKSALRHRIPYTTTLAGAEAACIAMRYRGERPVNALQGLYQRLLKGGVKQNV
jgi:carbamoyl-phosphate synthase large subunit